MTAPASGKYYTAAELLLLVPGCKVDGSATATHGFARCDETIGYYAPRTAAVTGNNIDQNFDGKCIPAAYLASN
jgi:hypothetical protein